MESSGLGHLELLAAIKKCSNRKDLECGRRLHKQVMECNQIPQSVFVWNSLVDLFGKCGSMPEARLVFQQMPARSIASWNALIRGYVHNGEPELALDLFDAMLRENMKPDPRSYVAALLACSNLRLLDRGIRLHHRLLADGWNVEENVFLASSLVEMYSRCGRMDEAWLVFDGMKEHTLGSWNSMISGHARRSQPELALERFALMQLDGFLPDEASFVAVCRACSSSSAAGKRCWLEKGDEIYEQLLSLSLGSNIRLVTSVVDLYSKCGCMNKARRVFDGMPRHDPVCWTALLLGYAESGEYKLVLKLFFEQMQGEEGIAGEAGSFVAALKACAGLAATAKEEKRDEGSGTAAYGGDCMKIGRKIQEQAAETLRGGSENSAAAVSTALLSLYSRCGEVGDARKLFDESLRYRDAALWTQMMDCYTENGQPELALELFEEMNSEDLDAPVFVAAANAVAKLSSARGDGNSIMLLKAREVEERAARLQELDRNNAYVGNSFISMYSKCKSVGDSQRVFDKLCVKTLVSWNSLMSAYVENGDCETGLMIFSRMQTNSHLSPDERSFVVALKACAKFGCLERGMALHSLLLKCGVHLNSFLVGSLVDMYVKCGSLSCARRVLDQNDSEVEQKSLVAPRTTMVMGYVQAGEPEMALELLERIPGKFFDPITFVAATRACSSVAVKPGPSSCRNVWLERVMFLHSLAQRFEQEGDMFLASTLVDAYASCGSLKDAERVFEAFIKKNSSNFLWNSMMMGFVCSGRWDSALELFCRMMDEVGEFINSVSFVAALAACSGLAKLEQADVIKCKSLEKGMAVHREALMKLGDKMEPSVGNSLVDMYSRCGSMEDALRVFQAMQGAQRTLQCLNNLMMGFAECGHGEKALDLFAGMEPGARDTRSYLAALKACSSVGVQAGKWIHSRVCEAGLEADAAVSASLVHLYSSCASMSEAQRVFDSGSAAAAGDLVPWNCLMGGYSKEGNSRRVLQLFSDLVAEKLTPDSITFVCVLTACAHAGLVEQGMEFFREMRELYGISARAEHLTCVVDLLGRVDAVEDALKLIKSKSFGENSGAWRALLSACTKGSNRGLAMVAFEKLLRSSESHSLTSSYVLVSNVCK